MKKLETFENFYQFSPIQQDLSKAETFWRQLLRGFTAPTSLVVNQPPRASKSQEKGGFGEQEIQLSMAQTLMLRSWAQQHQLTLNTLLQGTWALLLSRYSDEADIVFGATTDGHLSSLLPEKEKDKRKKEKEENEDSSVLPSTFSLLPVRVRVSPEMSPLRWLKELQAQWIVLRDYDHVPLVKIQEWSDLPPGMPLFDSILVCENDLSNSKERRTKSKPQASPLRSWENQEVWLWEKTIYPLTLIGCVESELLLKIKYDQRRFDDATIARMLGHIKTLLEGIVANPEQRISDLPLLTERERHQLLVEWNDTFADYPHNACIHQLFEAQVERSPDAVAVVFEDKQLTYQELNQQANQLAHHLQALDLDPEVVVGICVKRSLEMVVGLLGILKAGGAYVPLDPAYPQERLAFILENAQVPVLLTQQQLLDKLPCHGPRVVCMDADWEAIARESKENPVSGVRSDNLAYAIYTSGSTGKPKGVQIEHRGVVNLLNSVREQPGLTAQDTLLSVTTLSFDIAVSELFLPLSVGARLVVVSREAASDGTQLLKTLTASGATFLQATPVTWRLLLAAGWTGSHQLKMICTGEALAGELANQLLPKGASLWNLYGPTETTIWSATYKVESGNGPLPIGRPLANTHFYILDSHLQPVPIGVPGELHIGGDGLSRGYLNRAKLTAEKFIPNPFSKEPGARLYKTGDLARYLPDGNIECLGRIDYQVKIRGFRIELGEIETLLGSHPTVREAVVVAREDVPGNKRLVAYIVAKEEQGGRGEKFGSGVLPSELRRFLNEKLPDYMVPAAFVLIESLPLTPNGKVDRRALPAPGQLHSGVEEAFVAPRTPVEELLAKLWTHLLGVEPVGIHDEFFELGGHSLLATLLVSRIREALQVDLPLRSLFEAPTVAGLAEIIETRSLSDTSQFPPMQPVARDGNLPLSFAQQRLWFLDQLKPGISFYNMPVALCITGTLNAAALECSINEIIKRHEALRTTFAKVNGQPIQIIASTFTLSLAAVDLRSIPESEREVEAMRLATLEAQRSFDLTQVPLLRATLLQLGEAEHVLLLTMHHIVSDAWSMDILLREMAVLYQSFSKGDPSPLPELPIQYADFAVWQRQWLQGEVLEKQLSYWKQQLGSSLPVLQLPTDRPRPAVQTFRGRIHSLVLPQGLSEVIAALSQQEGVTPYITLLATFQTLLYRYTGQDDIVLGTAIANRNWSEIERLIGFFVNTLVIRADLSGNCTFRELLSRVREVALGAYSHQDVPFEKLVEKIHPNRDLSQNPLFQVMFVFQTAPLKALEIPGLTLNCVDVHNGSANFDLTLHLQETPSGISGWFEYNTDLFNDDTIARMAGHFQTLLEGIVANPEQRISDLPLLTERERHQLLVEWNDTFADYPHDACIHQLFEAQVERSPDAVAVVFEDKQLTYQELNQQANQLAQHLRALGVGPEVIVGLYMERASEMIVGLLGILKAGGAYLPLDPAYSKERLTFMLEDAKVSVLLTQARLMEGLLAQGIHVICLDTGWEAIARESQENPVNETTAENLAYVIYTSGSTGKPKGAMIQHRSLVNYTEAASVEYGIEKCDRILQFASISFDASAEEIYSCLTRGATLVLRTDFMLDTVSVFLQKCQDWEITVLDLPTAYWHELTARLNSQTKTFPSSLRLVIIGGEKALPDRLTTWHKQMGQRVRLVNTYGPTEATIVSTMCELAGNDQTELDIRELPIGRPIRNTQTYVLDQYLQPVPIGVPGELHIAGAGLARGYLNHPELTDLKFIPNPYSDEPRTRLYKTGDLVRYLPDGNIEFLGRLDHQVKIRGFRIELGEIEAVLSKHPVVWESLVIAWEDVPGNKRLVAYIVPNQEQSATISELRGYLKQKLPPYMVPSAFVMLDTLPLTPNGKVDRRLLPAPDTARPELEEAYQAPLTPEEKVLADIWAQVLGLEQVGIYDNFFALGGDSIRSIQVQALAQKKGLSLSLQQLFQHQTIHELVQELRPTEGCTIIAEPVQPFSLISEADQQRLPGDVEDAYPLTMLQIGMLFHSELSPDTAIYHNITSFHLKAHFDFKKLQTAVQQLAVRHPVLRTSFDLNNFSEPLQLVHKATHIPLQVEDQRHLSPAEQEEALATWFEAEKSRKFDCTQAPLLRFQIHHRSEETFQFSFTEHHAILDGWSTASMLTELFGHYFSLLNKEAHSIQPFPMTTFREFVALERQAIASKECQRYWTEKLNDSTITMLPRWHSSQREANVRQFCVRDVPLSPEISEGLKRLAQFAGVPLKSVLLAAHLRVLGLLSGQSDVLTGLVANGRPEQTDGERVLGLFLNTLPFHLQLSGGTWIDLVREVFEAERELLPFRRYPLVQLQRDLGGQPLFEIVFNFMHFHVFQEGLGVKDVQLLSEKFFGETNFTFSANFSLNPTSSQVEVVFEYDASELCSEQIKSISGYYVKALAAMVSEPHGRYELRSLLSAQEQHQLLVEWNGTQAADYHKDVCIHELFEAQVEHTPDAVAVVFEQEQLTYRELNNRANQVAHFLQRLGVGPDVFVGLYMERSPDMILGLLGILKAGGTYVPLDPNYPKERLAFMLEDANVPVLVTQQRLVKSLPEHAAKMVCLDSDWELVAQESENNSLSCVTASNLIYVIYTSGSTGKPKGVMTQHRALVNFSLAIVDIIDLNPSHRFLQFASLSFDASALQIFTTLISGATLVLHRNPVELSTKDLMHFCEQQRITILDLPAAFWHQWVDDLAASNASVKAPLKVFMTGGESTSLEQVRTWASLTKQRVTFLSSYGPTEGTISTTIFRTTNDTVETICLPRLPIGRPIANIQVYLLDHHLQPTPIGVPGELHIGGVGLALGYLNRPELTAQKFIPNPFSEEPGARLYKTGDLARYLPDGTIAFLGRLDDQVKIRGFRIELGEIEVVLSQHPTVREVAVMALENVLNDKRLVAYVVLHREQSTSVSELRRFLKARLPEYMIPATFVLLETLPLTANGKVDRRALPVINEARPALQEPFIVPRNTLELQLAHIWEDILNVHPIGVKDNFFELGGHSLLAVRLMAQIQKQFGQELSLSALFQGTTIESLADIVRQQTVFQSRSPLVEIQHAGSKQPFFCVHPAGGNVFCYVDLARHLGREQPLYGLQAPGLNGEQEPYTQVEDMAAHYIEALRVVQPQGPYFLGGWSMGGIVAFEMAQQLQAQGQKVAQLILLDASVMASSEEPTDEVTLLSSFAQEIGLPLDYLDLYLNHLLQLEFNELLACVLEQAKMTNMLSPDVELPQVRRLFHIFKTNVQAMSNYIPKIYPGQLALFRATELLAEFPDNPTMGWDKLAAGGVELHVLPGNHYTILKKPHIQSLAEQLKLCLNAAVQ